MSPPADSMIKVDSAGPDMTDLALKKKKKKMKKDKKEKIDQVNGKQVI